LAGRLEDGVADGERAGVQRGALGLAGATAGGLPPPGRGGGTRGGRGRPAATR